MGIFYDLHLIVPRVFPVQYLRVPASALACSGLSTYVSACNSVKILSAKIELKEQENNLLEGKKR